MLKSVLLVVMVTVVAQVFPSCGGEEGTEIVGWVEAKRVESATRSWIIVINNVEYDVPAFFWSQVEIGDLVKYDGKAWTIVKKANAQMNLLDFWSMARSRFLTMG